MGLCSSKIPDGDEESTTASTVTNTSEEISSKESEKTHGVLFGEWVKVDEKPLGRGAAYVIFLGVGKSSHLTSL